MRKIIDKRESSSGLLPKAFKVEACQLKLYLLVSEQCYHLYVQNPDLVYAICFLQKTLLLSLDFLHFVKKSAGYWLNLHYIFRQEFLFGFWNKTQKLLLEQK